MDMFVFNGHFKNSIIIIQLNLIYFLRGIFRPYPNFDSNLATNIFHILTKRENKK